jgi:hypothetical protein
MAAEAGAASATNRILSARPGGIDRRGRESHEALMHNTREQTERNSSFKAPVRPSLSDLQYSPQHYPGLDRLVHSIAASSACDHCRVDSRSSV